MADDPKLTMGLPKGSLQEPTRELFRKAGYEIYVSSRSYRPVVDDPDRTTRGYARGHWSTQHGRPEQQR